MDNGHHGHHESHSHGIKAFAAPVFSFAMLLGGMVMDHLGFAPFAGNIIMQYVWYGIAFLPVGLPVVREAVAGMASHDWFNEFTLMTIACIGAFCIGELPEAVGVMAFYSVGETLQDMAVDKATRNISRLVDVRGKQATVIRDGKGVSVDPEMIGVGEMIEVGPGERVELDGTLLSSDSLFDTSALTGESVPREVPHGGEVLAGMISLQKGVRVRVTKAYSDSTLSRILDMVREASSRKAHAELFIRRFAKIYTPVVVSLALLVVVIPALVSLLHTQFEYHFSEWVYRSLVFLVISCPCALVISVPLGYFAGIGAASRLGILFKGGNYLEKIGRIDTVAFDKTGTLTTGRFSVEDVSCAAMDPAGMLSLMSAAESSSSHPLAKALESYVAEKGIVVPAVESMSEKPGFGAVSMVDGLEVLAGNVRLLHNEGIQYPDFLDKMENTVIACAVDGKYVGYVALADTLKPDASKAVSQLHDLGINDIVMLSGDKDTIAKANAVTLGIKEAYGDMLPQDKAAYVERVASMTGRSIAFVGDGMNDAPVLAVSDVGIAMGGLGSDVAIESADIIIQTDEPSRVPVAVRIGRETHSVVKENIIGAIAIKIIIMILGAMGYASLWAAVFADVGVALLAVVNSMRILWKKY